MKLSHNTDLERRIETMEQAVQDLANQHRQIAINHAELLKMILQLQMQIDDLQHTP